MSSQIAASPYVRSAYQSAEASRFRMRSASDLRSSGHFDGSAASSSRCPVEFGERRLIAGCQLRSQVLHRAFPSGHHNHDPA
jgi:hypothetical protein